MILLKKYKKYLEIVGRFITIICLLLIFYQLVTQDIDYSILLQPRVLIIILISALIVAFDVYVNTECWKLILEALFDTKIKYLDTMNIYVKSNLGKYLPGNIMHFAGRNLIGKKYNLSHKKMVTATMFEIVLKVLCVAIIIVTFAYESFQVAIVQYGIDDKTIFVLIGFILISVAIFIFLYNKRQKNNNSYRVNYFKLVLVFVLYSFIFLSTAFCFILLSGEIVSWNIIIENFPKILGSYLIAWLIGYLVPGSSGGIGIRESVMMILLSELYGTDKILLVSVLLRIVTTLGDLFAYGIMKYGVKKIWKDRFTEKEQDMAIEPEEQE